MTGFLGLDSDAKERREELGIICEVRWCKSRVLMVRMVERVLVENCFLGKQVRPNLAAPLPPATEAAEKILAGPFIVGNDERNMNIVLVATQWIPRTDTSLSRMDDPRHVRLC